MSPPFIKCPVCGQSVQANRSGIFMHTLKVTAYPVSKAEICKGSTPGARP